MAGLSQGRVQTAEEDSCPRIIRTCKPAPNYFNTLSDEYAFPVADEQELSIDDQVVGSKGEPMPKVEDQAVASGGAASSSSGGKVEEAVFGPSLPRGTAGRFEIKMSQR